MAIGSRPARCGSESFSRSLALWPSAREGVPPIVRPRALQDEFLTDQMTEDAVQALFCDPAGCEQLATVMCGSGL